jgi:hypothetical protein
MTDVTRFTAPGPLTDLAGVDPAVLADLPPDPIALCRLPPGLVIQPPAASALGLPAERLEENQIRPAAGLVAALLTQDPAPLTVPREPAARVVGTCRHFAVLACALLRHRGIPARARCGFATYFQPGQGLDHWVVEYWAGRWVRVDAEVIGQTILARLDDLQPGEFYTGGEAWAAYRAGSIDAQRFGVYGTENWGPAEIRGNAVRDLAALNKVEMLPWDEWGRMTVSYKGETGDDYDELLDRVTEAAAGDSPERLYQAEEELRVPAEMIR